MLKQKHTNDNVNTQYSMNCRKLAERRPENLYPGANGNMDKIAIDAINRLLVWAYHLQSLFARLKSARGNVDSFCFVSIFVCCFDKCNNDCFDIEPCKCKYDLLYPGFGRFPMSVG